MVPERHRRHRLLAIGVDGAPGGWVAVGCWGRAPDAGPGERVTELRFVPAIDALVRWRADQAGGRAAPVAVDIPIGLPEAVGFRACDVQARERLPGAQKASVFQVPSRRLLVCAAEPHDGRPPRARIVFERARTLVAEEQERRGAGAGTLRRLTQQAAGILGKVAEVDALLRADPGRWDGTLFEVHPELSFGAMAGGTAPPPKTSAQGQLQRLDLVRAAFPDADRRIRAWAPGRKLSLLDVCDAYAACWTGLRWAATGGGAADRRRDVAPALEVLGETAPGEPARETATGLAMRIVV